MSVCKNGEQVFGVSLELVQLWAALAHGVLYPLLPVFLRSTSIDFAENQLFPSSIGFSPLNPGHPRLLPQAWVRPSRRYYSSFSLPGVRSPGFGSSGLDQCLLNTCFYWAYTNGLKHAHPTYSLTHYAKGKPLLPNKQPRLVVSAGVQYLFHSPFRVLFHLSLTVLVHYRSE